MQSFKHNQSMNSDPAAKYYDEVYADFIDDKKTATELQLITQLVGPKARILDIGCGTGRHLIPLHHKGYQVTGIDASAPMLDRLKNKETEAKLIHANVLNTKINEKFDLIIMMWNVVNELAVTETDLAKLMEFIQIHLDKSGKALINLSYDEETPTDGLDFYFETKGKSNSYQVNWKILEYLPDRKITHSQEHIKVFDQKNQIVDSSLMIITQRWWSFDQIINSANHSQMDVLKLQLSGYTDTYMVLSNQEKNS